MISDYAFYNSIVTTSEDVVNGKTLTVPSNVKKIGKAAFAYSMDAYT